MLADEIRARVNAEAESRFPHIPGADESVNIARATRRLTFRQGVEWALNPEPTEPESRDS